MFYFIHQKFMWRYTSLDLIHPFVIKLPCKSSRRKCLINAHTATIRYVIAMGLMDLNWRKNDVIFFPGKASHILTVITNIKLNWKHTCFIFGLPFLANTQLTGKLSMTFKILPIVFHHESNHLSTLRSVKMSLAFRIKNKEYNFFHLILDYLSIGKW